MSNTDHREERRRFHRILFDAPAQLHLGEHRFETRLVDISLKGALLLLPPGWPTDSRAHTELEIQLDDTENRICMSGDIVHQEAGHIGLICRQIDMDSITHLRRLVELNLGDEELLERELEALG